MALRFRSRQIVSQQGDHTKNRLLSELELVWKWKTTNVTVTGAKLEPYAKLKLSWSLKWVTYSTTTFSFWTSLGSVTYQCLKKKKIKSFTIPPFQTRQQCDWELEFGNSEFSFMCVNVTLLVLVTGKLDFWSTHCKNGQDRFPLDAQNCKGWSQWPGMASRFPLSCKLSLFRWMQSARKGNLTQTGTNGHFTKIFFFLS